MPTRRCSSCGSELDARVERCLNCRTVQGAQVSLSKDRPASPQPPVDLFKAATEGPEPVRAERARDDSPGGSAPRRLRTASVVVALVLVVICVFVAVIVTGNSDGSQRTAGQARSAQTTARGQDTSTGDPAASTAPEPAPQEPSPAGTGDSGSAGGDKARASLRNLVATQAGRAEELQGAWVPQLASSGPGETAAHFLAKYEELSGRYPNAVVIWSGDWPGSFGPSSSRSWVVLNAAETSPTTRPVLEWCSSEGWDPGACWARRLAKTGDDPSLNTDHYPADDRNN